MNRLNMQTVLCTAALVLPLPAHAATISGIDALKEWNLIVLGTLTSSSEVEGRTFVGGDLDGNSSNYEIKGQLPATAGWPGLTVVGNVNGGTKNLNNGAGAIVGGNVSSGFNLNGPNQTVQVGGTISNTNVNSNTVLSNQDAVAGFTQSLTNEKNALATSLPQLSQSLSKLTANSQVIYTTNSATFNATPNASGLAVFSLNASQLPTSASIAFNLNGADTAIVNVLGNSVALTQNFVGNTNGLPGHVIWNFEDATSFSLTTNWEGSVLAPDASATTSDYIQGAAVFKSLNENGEFHLGTYAGTYTPGAVPEPASWMLMLFGVATLGAVLRRGVKPHRSVDPTAIA